MSFHCYLSAYQTSLRHHSKGIGVCSGTLIRNSEVRNIERPLHGSIDSLDLMLLRSGRIVNWSDVEEVNGVEFEYVCEGHLSSLLVNWDRNRFGTKTNGKTNTVCSLHQLRHPKTSIPETRIKIQKEDAIFYMENIGSLCHVGSPVCQGHFEAMRAKNIMGFESTEVVPGKAKSKLVFNDEESSSGMDLNDLESLSDPTYIDEPIVNELPTTHERSEEEKIRDLRSILSEFGIKRITSDKAWNILDEETRKRKIRSIVSFLDKLFMIAAGDDWEEMKHEFMQKMRLVEKDPRIEMIMQTIGTCLEDTQDKVVRLSVLKLVTGLFTEKEISTGTGASRYLIRQAKVSEFGEARREVKFIRENFKKAKVLPFLRFVARPEILRAIPNTGKLMKLNDGREVPVAAMCRVYSYREIFQLYHEHWEEVGRSKGLTLATDIAEFVRVHSLGYSTAYKLMDVLAPNRQLRMSCVDSFQADAYDAFDALTSMVEELLLLNEIDDQRASDLRRRIRVAKNFMIGEMRLHIVQESPVIDHCWTHALSDGKDSNFSKPCSHAHDSACNDCSEAVRLPSIMKAIVKSSHAEASSTGLPIRYRLGRLVEISAESETLIRRFRHHIMKILPTDSVERQSNWFAKAGVSFHMGAVLARINGSLVSHAFGHLSSISKQDSTSVSGILEHSMKILKENGVTHIHFRSDNAGNYHCIGLVATLFSLAQKLGIAVLSHIFSEPQFGKGSADRNISICKSKLGSYIDSGKSACSADEMLSGFTHNILLKGCSFYIIDVTPLKSSKAVLKGIKQFSSFRFEDGGIRVRKHDAIGEGMTVEKELLPPIQYNFKVHREGGYTSGAVHFWKEIAAKNDGSAELEHIEKSAEDAQAQQQTNFRYCPDMLCRKRFTTSRGLDAHTASGKHEYFKSDTNLSVTDYGALMFSTMEETTEAAQLAVHNDSIVQVHTGDRVEERVVGWALRRNERAAPLDKEVKKEVENMVMEHLNADRRAEARDIRDRLRELKLPCGQYRFTLKKCLSESQVKSQIARLLTLKKKNAENGDGAESGESGEQTEEQATTGEEQEKEKGTNARKRTLQEMEEEGIDEGTILVDDVDSVQLMVDEIQKVFDLV